jgi:hypothetical protein
VAEFSAADAAFTGFRIVWQRPWAVAIWAGVQFVFSLALQLFMVISAGPLLMKMTAMGATSSDPGAMLDSLRQLAPTYVVILIAALVLSAVFYAAMNRAVMRPQESRFGYLRLAADELRQLGLLAALALVFFGVELVFVVVGAVVFAVLDLAFGGGGIAVALGLALLLPALICGFVFVGVRFSLATPMTFATGKIDLFGSWRLTRGRFWPLLGTYFLALVLSLVVSALTFVIAALVVGIIGGGFSGIGAAMQSDLSSVQATLTPARLIYLAITSIGAALASPITMCPPAAIYRSLTGGGPGAVGKVFD